MSLILEALRRSEAERRLGEAPGLHAPDAWRALPGRGGRHDGARWPWIALGAASAMALAAAAGAWWMRAERAAGPAPSPAAQPATVAGGAPEHAALPAPREAPAVAVPAPTIPPPAPAPAPAPAPVPAASMPVAPPPAPAAAPPPVASAAPAAIEDRPPPLDALDPARRAALPPLRLGLHLWDEAPARRRVVIDGQRHLEGAWITPEVRLVAIVRGGCILEIDGRRWWLGVA